MLGFNAIGRLALGELTASGPYYYIRPSADDTDGTWTTHAGGSSLYEVIDEAIVDDSDCIRSDEAPANDLCKIALSNPGVIPAEPMTVIYRYKKDLADGTMELRVRLLEGTTQIASWTESDIGSDWVTTNRVLSSTEFASITDFDNLYIEFRANLT